MQWRSKSTPWTKSSTPRKWSRSTTLTSLVSSSNAGPSFALVPSTSAFPTFMGLMFLSTSSRFVIFFNRKTLSSSVLIFRMTPNQFLSFNLSESFFICCDFSDDLTQQVPLDLLYLRHLQRVTAIGCKFSNFPIELRKLKSLTELNLQGNQIVSLPREIVRFFLSFVSQILRLNFLFEFLLFALPFHTFLMTHSPH